MPYTYDYPRPAVSVDCVVLRFDQDLQVLLIKRGRDPYSGYWALPGGFVEIDESLEHAARRELREETGLEVNCFEQLQAFGDPQRDPRGRVISVAFLAMVSPDKREVKGADDARLAAWFPLEQLPPLAFDHKDILACAMARLRIKIATEPFGRELLPTTFAGSQLVALYRSILGQRFDELKFQQWAEQIGLLEPCENSSVELWPECRFRFNQTTYEQLKNRIPIAVNWLL